MSEHPIIFSGGMVQAILDGRKTQTRRVIKPQPPPAALEAFDHGETGSWGFYSGDEMRGHTCHASARCPYGVPGDRLWLRESWQVADHDFANPPSAWLLQHHGVGRAWWANPPEEERAEWAERFGTAGTTGGPDPRVRPSIHMPRWASRLTLEVCSVRVERVTDIRSSDIHAEGVFCPEHTGACVGPCPAKRAAFRELWDSINAKRGFGWEARPWVWVISFRVVPAEATLARARGKAAELAGVLNP